MPYLFRYIGFIYFSWSNFLFFFGTIKLPLKTWTKGWFVSICFSFAAFCWGIRLIAWCSRHPLQGKIFYTSKWSLTIGRNQNLSLKVFNFCKHVSRCCISILEIVYINVHVTTDENISFVFAFKWTRFSSSGLQCMIVHLKLKTIFYFF